MDLEAIGKRTQMKYVKCSTRILSELTMAAIAMLPPGIDGDLAAGIRIRIISVLFSAAAAEMVSLLLYNVPIDPLVTNRMFRDSLQSSFVSLSINVWFFF